MNLRSCVVLAVVVLAASLVHRRSAEAESVIKKMKALISANTSDWMKENAPLIQNKSIKDIVLPGTHDSATYNLSGTIAKGQALPEELNYLKWAAGVGFALADVYKKWSVAQNRTILQQLEDGFRFIDLRVTYWQDKNAFYIVHGLFGPPLKDVLGQITTFVNLHPQEILVIQVGGLSAMPPKGHERLLGELQSAFGDKLASKADGLNIPLKDLWQKHKQIFLIYDGVPGKDGVPEEMAQNDKIWEHAKFLDSYWANQTSAANLKKILDEHLKSRNASPCDAFEKQQDYPWCVASHNLIYVVQSVLTPSSDSFLKDFEFWDSGPSSLHDLDARVKKEFPTWLQSWKDKNPNVILVDFGDKIIAEEIIQLNQAAK